MLVSFQDFDFTLCILPVLNNSRKKVFPNLLSPYLQEVMRTIKKFVKENKCMYLN